MEDTSVRGAGDKRFQVLIIIILTILALCAVVPFILLLSSSLTDDTTLMKFGYNFFPRKFSAYAYEYLFSTNGENVFRAYGITILITVVGTVLSLLIAPMLAFPLSRRDYKRARLFTFLIFFTMLFNGGIVPAYLMWTTTFHIKNTIWALIIPNLLMNGFNVILYKNNFATNIHPALIEAAKIDGASEWTIYFKIVLPLSLPILATVGLMVGLGYWNDWTNGLYYVTKPEMYTFQALLNRMINQINFISSGQSMATSIQASQIPGVSVRMGIAALGVVPLVIMYPFFQKYFIGGLTVGAVKG